MGLVAFLTAAAVLAPVGQEFRAVPPELEDIYRFDLAANFYADEAAFRADLDSLVTAIGGLEELKGRVTVSGDTLLLALSSYERLYPRWYKLWVYANLRYAINTEDMRLMHKIQEASGDLSSRLQFINNEVERLEDRTLQQLVDQEPMLRQLEFAIEDIRRHRPHRLSLGQEELLAKLDPLLLPWFEEMYQKVIDHTEFDSIQAGTGERLDVRLDYGRLIRDEERDVRRRAFLGHFGAYSQHRDLLSYVLLRELKTYNSLARLRDFPGRQEQKFFDLCLQPPQVWNVYSQIEAKAGLAKRHESLRMARVADLTEIADVHAWDMSVVPGDFTRPRYNIVEATDLIRDALAPLGEEYAGLLSSLLDPAQGRIDIVAGPKRVPGAFSTGYYGHPHLFFSQKYEGYLGDLSTLVHESGHAVHHELMYNAGVRPLYAYGPTYVTESVAMLNELLLKDHLWEMSKQGDLDTRIFFLEKLVGEATALSWLAEIALLESALYDSVEAGVLSGADDLDRLTLSVSSRFRALTQKHPHEYKRLWSMVEHFYVQPMYNVNYVFAHVLALRFYQQMRSDPTFVSSYLRLLQHPFDRPAPEILRDIVGTDLEDPRLLQDAFVFIERKLDALEDLYREAGVEIK